MYTLPRICTLRKNENSTPRPERFITVANIDDVARQRAERPRLDRRIEFCERAFEGDAFQISRGLRGFFEVQGGDAAEQ